MWIVIGLIVIVLVALVLNRFQYGDYLPNDEDF